MVKHTASTFVYLVDSPRTSSREFPMLTRRSVLFALPLFLPLNAVADDTAPAAGSPDGNRRAVGDGKAIKIFDVATGKIIIQIQAHTDKVTALAFSPDGKQLVSGSDDKTVRVFDTTTGAATIVMKGHDASITLAGFSIDGKTITTVDKNKKSIKWDPATGKQLP